MSSETVSLTTDAGTDSETLIPADIVADVTALYENLLFRLPDQTGLSGWSAELNSGQLTVQELINDFVNAPEATTNVDPIIRLYEGLYSRLPDFFGMQDWVGKEDAGMSLNQIAQYFVTSQEFYADYGTNTLSNPTAFVEALYENFLGRTADPGGLATWVAALGATPTVASEAAVVLAFANSAEYLNDHGSDASAWLSSLAPSAVNGIASIDAYEPAPLAATGILVLGPTASGVFVSLGDAGYQTMFIQGDDSVLQVFSDDSSPNILTTVYLYGDITINAFEDTALTTIDASNAGPVTIGASQNNLTIIGPLEGLTLTATGSGDVISIGTADNIVSTSTNAELNEIGAPGNGDTITIEPLTGTTTVLAGQASNNLDLATGPLGANDTVNVGTSQLPGGDVQMWVGPNATINLTANSTALIDLQGDVTGASSSGIYALTTVDGANDTRVGLTLEFNNAPTETWAGGTEANSQVNVTSATSVANALDLAASQAAVLDTQFDSGAHSTTVNGTLTLNASTGLVDWFQYGGNTYLVEAVNNTASPAVHTALGTNDVVVELVGLVDVSHISMTFA